MQSIVVMIVLNLLYADAHCSHYASERLIEKDDNPAKQLNSGSKRIKTFRSKPLEEKSSISKSPPRYAPIVFASRLPAVVIIRACLACESFAIFILTSSWICPCAFVRESKISQSFVCVVWIRYPYTSRDRHTTPIPFNTLFGKHMSHGMQTRREQKRDKRMDESRNLSIH